MVMLELQQQACSLCFRTGRERLVAQRVCDIADVVTELHVMML
jgi:hypothetical protein